MHWRRFAWAAACASVGFGSSKAAVPAPPPASAFGRLPAIQDIAISPDGTKVATLGGPADQRVISIAPIDGKQPIVVGIGKAQVRSLRWAGDSYILVKSSALDKFTDNSIGGTFAYHLDRDFVLTADGKVKGFLLQNDAQSNLMTGLPVLQVTTDPDPAAIILSAKRAYVAEASADTNIPRHGSYLVPVLWRVDIAKLAAKQVEQGQPATDTWDIDGQGNARVRLDSDDKGFRILVRAVAGGAWKTLLQEKDPEKRPSYLGYSAQEAAVYVAEDLPEQQTRVMAVSTADGSKRQVGEPLHGSADLLIDPYTRDILAICAEWDSKNCQWRDSQLGDWHAKLSRAFPGKLVSLHHWSKDRRFLLLSVEAPDAPPSWYLFDSSRSQLSPIGDSYPELQGAALGKTSWFVYKARDGLQIPAYLTVPPAGARNAPLIVLPHGGPAARDDYRFDWWAQFLATRGYVVLQPQFRGSGGFGRGFERAGHKEWAGKMQTDLLDGIADLAAKGVIDPKRVCIVGASYGGYAALAGAAFHPEAYRCAVSVNGVSDLAAFLGEEARNYGAASDSVGYWRSLLGRSGADAAQIAAASPSRHASDVRGPVLLIFSAEDTTVPPQQTEIMAHALDLEERPAQVVKLPGDDHYLSSSASRTQMLEAIDVFLAKNLPVR